MYCMPAAGLDLEVLAGRSAAKENSLAALRLRLRLRAGDVKRPVSIRSSAELQHRLNFQTLREHARIARGVYCFCDSCSLLWCCTYGRVCSSCRVCNAKTCTSKVSSGQRNTGMCLTLLVKLR